MQTWGENYWETYAPVVNWLSVRIMLALTTIHDLDARSMDFILAFPQAELDVDIYMELPYSFSNNSDTPVVLKLKKNLYGLKQAAYNWHNMLKTGIEARGFKPSAIDSCVYLRKDCILLVYVDDCIIISKKNTRVAADLMKSLKDEGFKLEDEGDLNKFLGVDVQKESDGTIHLKQEHLIQRFLKLVKITEEEHAKDSPSLKPVLSKDTGGLERRHTWNYRQAIGMLNYMQSTTRPDIAYAAHQCARFCNDPKLCHERAVRRIGKYLKGTGTSKLGLTFKVAHMERMLGKYEP